MRLVPNQNPDDIFKKYEDFIKSITPKGIQIKIKVHSKGEAIVVGTDNKYIKAATEAMHDVFKKDTVYIRSGGSIPIVTDFENVLQIPSRDDGPGLAGRQSARPQREVPYPELLPRDRVDHQLLPPPGGIAISPLDHHSRGAANPALSAVEGSAALPSAPRIQRPLDFWILSFRATGRRCFSRSCLWIARPGVEKPCGFLALGDQSSRGAAAFVSPDRKVWVM